MKLEELIPEESKFYIKSLDRELRLRPFTLSDELWVSREFGHKEIENSFRDKIDPSVLCQLIYYQLIDEDKRLFKSIEESCVDEDGNDSVKKLKAYEVLARHVTGGYKEQMEMFNAYFKCRGFTLDEKSIDANPVKKKIMTRSTGA